MAFAFGKWSKLIDMGSKYENKKTAEKTFTCFSCCMKH